MNRPLIDKSVDELTEMFARCPDNLAELDIIHRELGHRDSDRGSQRLRSVIEQHISTMRSAERAGYEDDLGNPEEVNNMNTSAFDQAREWTNEAVAKLRAKLIDLSRRSPLISFKHASRSASQLRFVDERIDVLWETLSEKPMAFEPLPGEEQTPPDEQTPQFKIAYERARLTDEIFQVETEKLGDHEEDAGAWQEAERNLRAKVRGLLGLPKLDYGKGVDVASIARAHGFDPSFDLKFSDDGDLSAHHTDQHIRVLLTQKELEKRLKTIWDRSGTHLRETGLHTLHIVFGFVQWFEDASSDIPMQAPLLLMPVGLGREITRGRFEYILKSNGDELEVNSALTEKARSHWGLQLPQLRNGESPESYFIRTKEVLEKGSRLKLNTYVTLAVLPPMILWKDLDASAWPSDAFANHRLLPSLLGAKEFSQSNVDDGGSIDIDDPVNASRVPALITDADASQHHAIMDMAAGHDMAIEGPPGTGKSQTITNMIATALAMGKRVLFVAEKQAALRVVSDRLRFAGFGPLLLELHGDRAVRSEVYDGIQERLDFHKNIDIKVLEEKRAELKRHRDLLRRYSSLMGEPLGALGISAHELAWREIRLSSIFTREQVVAMESRWGPPDPKLIDRAKLTEQREILEQFGRALNTLDSKEEERTRWALAQRLNAFDQSTALDAAGVASEAAKGVAVKASELAEQGLVLPLANDEYLAFSEMLSALQPISCSAEHEVLCAVNSGDVAVQLLEAQTKWNEVNTHLAVRIERPESITVETVTTLASSLVIDDCPATPESALAECEKFEGFIHRLTLAERDMSALGEKLSHGLSARTECGAKVARAMAGLSDLPAGAISLMHRNLMDPMALVVATAAEGEAIKIRTERDAVLEAVNPDTLKMAPEELDALAEILDSTGLLGRLGGHFRRSMRKASRLLMSETHRTQAADTLHKAAAVARAVREFEQSSKARNLVPPLLWDGIDTDFVALRSACTAISEATNTLVSVDEIEILERWLDSDAVKRQRFCASCTRISTELMGASEAGMGAIALDGVLAACQERYEDLRRLHAASVAATLKGDCPFHWDSQSVASHLSTHQNLRCEFDRLREQETFGWVGEITCDLSALRISLSQITSFAELPFGDKLIEALQSSPTPSEMVRKWIGISGSLNESIANWHSASHRLEEMIGVSASNLTGADDWMELSKVLKKLQNDRHGAGLAADLLKYREAAVECGLQAFAEAAIENLVDTSKIDDLYELLSISALLRVYLGGTGSELSRLGSLSLKAARKAFKRVDKDLHKLEAAAIVAARLNDKITAGRSYGRRSEYTELSLLNHEVELTRPRTPLRDVVHRAGSALQSLKPVWMMSPTSVAQFIRPGELQFDLLIVDEASQMRPEFSISCLLRADQFVVVGDANQLPPSDHFQVASSHDEEDDGVGVDDNTESILDLANQRFRRKPRLKWHYRSQHESLIQFSNREFYDRELVVFPSPNSNDDDLLGVKCTYVPAQQSDTVYESSINQREAEVIIEQAFGLMQSHPERSIGIVAMNAKQTELIQNEFDRLIIEDVRVARYVDAFSDTVEEFFIKNLENVQGDERDIILISSVYGPGKDGKVRQNFGLLNREVGWRRLNVLVTRAKMSCRLITSLRPDDVKVTENSSKGVIALKSYLTYAHNGAQYNDASGGETDSDFEVFVADAIRGAGYEVVYQVGVEKFRIDLGVRHESCPIGFIAGIECDGAPYHSGLSVRDRDNIRQSVLEGLGWRIYRVWSTDWFSDSARETAKLISWLDVIREEVVNNLADKKVVQVEPLKLSRPSVEVAVSEPFVPTNVAAAPDDKPADEIIAPSDEEREPRGRKLRPLDDIDPYEAIRGSLYEIWKAGEYLGEVEVMKRASANPRLYGDRVMTTRSEYEGRVFQTGDRFTSYDLYAAMREVARRAAEPNTDD